jgi:hypothetical protein
MPTRDNWTTAAGQFFAAIFGLHDHVSFRPTETWTEIGSNGKRQKKSRVIYKEARTVTVRHLRSAFYRLLEVCEAEKANFFFGVCPRFGRKHDKSWQIRVVRVLWADLDNCQPAEAIERCKKAGLPPPSILVNSGNGVHLYWLLAEPYLINDIGDPPAVEVEWIDQGQGKKKRKLEWYRDEAGGRHDLPHEAPELSAKAVYIQDVLSGIASAIGGDKTHDLARLLRVPDTLNRKDEGSGREPVPCELIEIHRDRRYEIDEFAKWADAAPSKKERGLIAAIPLSTPRKRISATKQDKLNELITKCVVAPVGERSERDWALICYAIRNGVPRDDLWRQVANVGKFAERGEDYFVGRWTKAEQTIREEIYVKQAGGRRNAGRKQDSNLLAADGQSAIHADGSEPTGRRRLKLDIDASDQNLARVTGNAWRAIKQRNDPPKFFRFGGIPARIEQSDDDEDRGAPLIRLLDLDRLRHVTAREANWWKEKRVGDQIVPVDAMPPKDVIKDMLATPEPPLPILRRIVEAPVVASDGTVLTDPGYHAASKTLFCPQDGLIVPPVPDSPSGDDLECARNLVTEELLGDFPFVDESDKAVSVACMVLPFARDLIAGPTPLHVIEKPCHGTGATLLVEVIAYPALGRDIAVMTEAGTEDEWRKRIVAKLRSAPPFLFIDNLRATLDSAALSAALTAPFLEDRELGYTRMLRVPVRCCWVASGNNPAVSGEVSRRIVACRLDAKMDQPWLRENSGFRHPDLKAWAHANRGQLIWAVLTMIRAWIAAGRPNGTTTLGKYEKWSAVMGGIMDVARIPGFLARESLNRFYDRADKEGHTWRAFAAAWWEAVGGKPKQVSELYGLVGEIDLKLGDRSEQSRRIRLGKLLGQMEDRVYRIEAGCRTLSVKIERGEKVHRAVTWRLTEVR